MIICTMASCGMCGMCTDAEEPRELERCEECGELAITTREHNTYWLCADCADQYDAKFDDDPWDRDDDDERSDEYEETGQ